MPDEPKDEFEDEMIKQLMELFSSMNLPMDERMFTNMVKDMIKQFLDLKGDAINKEEVVNISSIINPDSLNFFKNISI